MSDKEEKLYRIKDMSSDQRPRERLAEIGPQALTDAELLAILLRVGRQGENAVQQGQRLLSVFQGLEGLYRAEYADICQCKGIGPAKAAQIKAAIELGARMKALKQTSRPVIQSPQDAVDLVQYEMSALSQENLWVMLLDTRNRVLKINKLYRGSLNASTVRISELFRPAIQINAASLILFHNHPSGDASPSPEDITLTTDTVKAGKLLDIEVMDHIVIGLGSYVSLKERKLGF
ncbi:MAG: DNA repair protein RadC [Anaerolineaceae bacterium]|nr:DNA repair protein RadC [Anaerolineaceae bacterium]